MIRVPEPEVINTHPHLEILHETDIKSVQREPSQTEKGKNNNICIVPTVLLSNSMVKSVYNSLL